MAQPPSNNSKEKSANGRSMCEREKHADRKEGNAMRLDQRGKAEMTRSLTKYPITKQLLFMRQCKFS
jgi:hypothetical protein